jgi:hypothetical protein
VKTSPLEANKKRYTPKQRSTRFKTSGVLNSKVRTQKTKTAKILVNEKAARWEAPQTATKIAGRVRTRQTARTRKENCQKSK